MLQNSKIAIVYDWIDKWGGVERVLLTLHEMFPEADFYTSYFDSDKASWAKDLKIKTSFIQKLPRFIRENRIVSLPLYPYAFESFDFSGYDIVVSVTSSFAKGIITKPETLHICYLLTPTRFLWSHKESYLSSVTKKVLIPYINKLKRWDRIAAQRPDRIISISQTVADRCTKYYGRESKVMYPPFDISHWTRIKSEIRNSKFQINSKFKTLNIKPNFFLVVSRLEPYKKVDLVIDVFKTLGEVPTGRRPHRFGTIKKINLVIVGDGSEKSRLRKLAGENIEFLSELADEELALLYSQANALIMPQEEDFGYVSLEAQFFGCPVIAYNKGGARETIIEGKTGIFFGQQTEEALSKAIKRFDMIKYELKRSAIEMGPKNVERFAKDKFTHKFLDLLK